MKRFECPPDTEIKGEVLLPFINNLNADMIRPILAKHNLTEINPEQWYTLQRWLDVLKDLSTQDESMFNFVAIGLAVGETAPLPPGIEQVPFEVFFLNMYPQAYKMQFRNTIPGTVSVEKVADKHLLFKIDNPFPPDLVYGAIFGLAKRLMPASAQYTGQVRWWHAAARFRRGIANPPCLAISKSRHRG